MKKILTKKFLTVMLVMAYVIVAVAFSLVSNKSFSASADAYYESDAAYEQFVNAVDTRSGWTKFWSRLTGSIPQLEPVINSESQYADKNKWTYDKTMYINYGKSSTSYQNKRGDTREKVIYTNSYELYVSYDKNDWYSVTLSDLTASAAHEQGNNDVSISTTNSTSCTVTFSQSASKNAGANIGLGDNAKLSLNKTFSSSYSVSRTVSSNITLTASLPKDLPSGYYEAELHQQFQKYQILVRREKITVRQRKEGWWIFKSWKDKETLSTEYVDSTSSDIQSTEMYLARGNTTIVWHDEIAHIYNNPYDN